MYNAFSSYKNKVAERKEMFKSTHYQMVRFVSPAILFIKTAFYYAV